MKIRQMPISIGFDKKKLIALFVIIAIILFTIIFVVTMKSPRKDKSLTGNQNFARYSSNISDNDINNIVGLNKLVGMTASSPLVTAPKIQTSGGIVDANSLKQQEVISAQELKTAMKAPLSSNQITPTTSANTNGGSDGLGTGGNKPGTQDSGLPDDDQNMNAEKRNFIKSNSEVSVNIMSDTVQNQIAALVLSMGTKIPAQLDQEINSDLPGQIYGHVSRDVYDSRTHNKLLIPAGSNLVGTYDSALAYGQERLLVAWKRVNFPNGQWLDLPGLGGADPVGAGFGDLVDNHYWRIFGATLMTSVLAAGAQLSQPQQSDALQAPGVGQTLGQSVGTQIAQTGTMLVRKNINIKPTLHIRAGFEFTVEVNKDMIFNREYTANSNKS